MDRVWQDFLTIAREEVGTRVVDTWFKAISLERWDIQKSTAYLRAPNGFVCEWVRKRYTALLKTHLGRLLGVEEPELVFLNGTASSASKEVTPQNDLVVMPARVMTTNNSRSGSRSVVRPAGRVDHGINPGYTFDTFVVSTNSSLAYAAAHAVSKNPGTVYNPLFVYGDSGLGKTHLLHAIGNAIRSRDPSLTVLYQTTDRFVTDFINAIRFDKVHLFQRRYRSIDVLLIDDIQFICKKEQTQEAFFHIFNALYESKKQLVFSSDTFPQRMDGLAERLRSRLAWGLVTDLHAPCLETRIAILKKKTFLNAIEIDDAVLHVIATRESSNIRALEGALIRVVAHAALIGEVPSVELAERILIAPTPPPEQRTFQFEQIVEAVCRHYSYSFNELCSKRRDKELSTARHVAIFLMKKLTDKSLRDIGKFLGGRDHSTVMHALERITVQ